MARLVCASDCSKGPRRRPFRSCQRFFQNNNSSVSLKSSNLECYRSGNCNEKPYDALQQARPGAARQHDLVRHRRCQVSAGQCS
ncbi:hypothetical protein FOWG_16086 [Fusarium oxysporum f. sp. lycopersici MN25]|nr:hypothetical protein FOWG_16086 [Fusarium oxysporum f. sp. lycopersici MN25]